MVTKVEKSIEVEVPVRTAYDQWTQFEEFPRFMGGVDSVTQLNDGMTHWVASLGGIKREWDARILEQVPDTKVSWAATQGATNAGAVYFTPLGASRTQLRLVMEYEPEGLVEKAGDALNVIERNAESDLKRFKEYIEERGTATGQWRGEIQQGAGGTPGVEDAASSRGDGGKAGISKTAAVLGTVAAAAGVAAVAGAVKNAREDDDADAPSGSVAASAASTGTPMTTTPLTTDTTVRPPVEGASLSGAQVVRDDVDPSLDPDADEVPLDLRGERSDTTRGTL